MKNNQPQFNIKDQVLKNIKSGQIKMKSKYHFILSALLLIVGFILAFLLTLFLLSFVVFTLQAKGLHLLPSFGIYGYKALFFSLPWLVIIAAIIFFIILEKLAKKFKFFYRHSLLVTFTVIAISVVAGAIIILNTSMHNEFCTSAEKETLPFMGTLYRGYSETPKNIVTGKVTDIKPHKLDLTTKKGDILLINIMPTTKMPPERQIIINDIIMIVGKRTNGHINAIGIRKIDPRINPIFQSGCLIKQ